MPPMPFKIDPPLLNSATPWATTINDLRALYNSPHTGAITIRTSLLQGFPHDPAIHQYTFFSSLNGAARSTIGADGRSRVLPDETSSLNTLGYSPIPLQQYLAWLVAAARGAIPDFHPSARKPIIVSITGSPDDIARCYTMIADAARDSSLALMMEINLSCPNIPDRPPPAYDPAQLALYLAALPPIRGTVPCGFKTPPYTHAGQYASLISALLSSSSSSSPSSPCPLAFLTATNTLGSCLVLRDDGDDHSPVPALHSVAGDGLGGLAGAVLHPLALGNVATLRRQLDTHAALAHVAIIGVGGVSDAAGFARMRSVGAEVVAVGTALGREGVDVFRKIREGD